jgi:hypothetical protein
MLHNGQFVYRDTAMLRNEQFVYKDTAMLHNEQFVYTDTAMLRNGQFVYKDTAMLRNEQFVYKDSAMLHNGQFVYRDTAMLRNEQFVYKDTAMLHTITPFFMLKMMSYSTEFCASLTSGFRQFVESTMFWDDTEPRLVVSYGRFGTSYRSQFQWSSSPRIIFKMGHDRLSRNVIRITNYTSRLRNIPE